MSHCQQKAGNLKEELFLGETETSLHKAVPVCFSSIRGQEWGHFLINFKNKCRTGLVSYIYRILGDSLQQNWTEYNWTDSSEQDLIKNLRTWFGCNWGTRGKWFVLVIQHEHHCNILTIDTVWVWMIVCGPHRLPFPPTAQLEIRPINPS